MAFSATKKYESQIGGLKFQIWNLNFASVTEGTFKTGMREIYFAAANNETTENDGFDLKNKSAASTAANGEMFHTSYTSSDLATLFVIGR